jgi:hypothetical protein
VSVPVCNPMSSGSTEKKNANYQRAIDQERETGDQANQVNQVRGLALCFQIVNLQSSSHDME